MTMNFHQRNKRKKFSRFFWLVVWLSVFVVTVLVGNVFSGGRISAVVKEVFANIENSTISTKTGIASAISSMESKKTLLKEQEKLKTEIAQLRNELSKTILLKIQNNTLKRFVTNTDDADLIPKRTRAKIIMQKGANTYGTLLLFGDMKNVRIGDIVLADNLYALGDIVARTKHTATVHLFTAPKRKLDVLLRSVDTDAEPVAMLARGVGYGNIVIDAPREALIKKEMFVFSKESHQYAIASVGDIKQSPTNEYIKVLARIPYNIDALQYVLIETQYADE